MMCPDMAWIRMDLMLHFSPGGLAEEHSTALVSEKPVTLLQQNGWETSLKLLVRKAVGVAVFDAITAYYSCAESCWLKRFDIRLRTPLIASAAARVRGLAAGL